MNPDPKQYKKRGGTSNVEGIKFPIMLMIELLVNALYKTKQGFIESFEFLSLSIGETERIFRLHYTEKSLSQKIFLKTKYKETDNEIDNGKSQSHNELSQIYPTEDAQNKQCQDECKYIKISLKKLFYFYQKLRSNKENDFCENSKLVLYTNSSFRFEEGEYISIDYANEQLTMFKNIGKWFSLNTEGNVESLYNLLKDDINLEEVKCFLNETVFLTNQPDIQSMKEEIKIKLSEQYFNPSFNIKESFSLLENKMTAWWQNSSSCIDELNTFVQHSMKVGITFGVISPDEYFTGRDAKFDDIKKLHNDSKNIVAVCGLGGVGKTELIKKYVSLDNSLYNGNVIWINALQLQQSCRGVAEMLGIDHEHIKEISDLIEQIYNYFDQSKCLFIFDNVSKLQDLKPVMKPLMNLESQPYFIITSRDRDAPDQSICVVDLDVLEEEEAIQLVCSSLSITPDENVKRLVKLLNRYPLALRQAISYIATTSISVFIENHNETINNVLHLELPDYEAITATTWNVTMNKIRELDHGDFAELILKMSDIATTSISVFIENYNEKIKDVLHLKLPVYEATTATTWNVTMTELRKLDHGAFAELILNIMAYIAPTDITSKMFLPLSPDNNTDEIRSGIRLLVKYSMIKGQGIFTVHEIVQKVFRMQIRDSGKEEEILSKVLLLFKIIDKSVVDHALYAWSYAINYPCFIDQYGDNGYPIMELLYGESRFTDALEFAKCCENLLKNDNPRDTVCQILKTWKVRARILVYQCDYENALREFDIIGTKEVVAYGENTEEVLNTEYHIGTIKRQQGHYEEALKILKSLVKRGNNQSYTTLMAKDEIATTHKENGEYMKAMAEYKEILKIMENVLQQDSIPEMKELILTTMDNIACVDDYLGNYRDAEIGFQEVLKLKLEFFKENHPSYSKSRNNYGVLLIRLGKFEDALKIFEARLEKLKKVYNNGRGRAVVIANYNISLAQFHLKDYEEAWRINVTNLKDSIKLFTEIHKIPLQISQLKGDILYMQEKYDDAKKVLETTLRDAREFFQKKDNLEILQTHNSIGCIHLIEGNLPKAEEIFKDVYGRKVKCLGQNHPETLITMHCLGKVYQKQKKILKAFYQFNSVYNKRKAQLGDEHYHTVESLQQINDLQNDFNIWQHIAKHFLYITEKYSMEYILAFLCIIMAVTYAFF